MDEFKLFLINKLEEVKTELNKVSNLYPRKEYECDRAYYRGYVNALLDVEQRLNGEK